MRKRAFSLNRNHYKYIAIICMLIDHIAFAFVPALSPLGSWMHFFGRFTGPFMAYFVVEGYIHTRNLKRYILRMGLFALISWPCFSLFMTGKITTEFGVIYTLFLGLLAIWVYDKFPFFKDYKPMNIIWKSIVITALFVLSSFGDWAFVNVLVPVGIFALKDKKYGKLLVYGIAQVYYFYICRYWFALGFIIPAILLTFCYNGESGCKSQFNKWFFYIFYPAHLLVLYIIRYSFF